tara:strand:- start:219 stop:815 length:597 start_codon:yes stop_codon:yes gene_type:complete
MARKKCPQGVFCIENITLIFLIIIVGIGYLIYVNLKNKRQSKNVFYTMNQPTSMPHSGFNFNIPTNVLSNPFIPPLKDGNYFPKNNTDPRGIPINVRTRGFDSTYRQVGILSRKNGDETILPLMGRPLDNARGQWQFYTISDKHTSVKLPISKNGRSCTGEYGCSDLYNGDVVYVEGYGDAFKVTIYENNTPTYIPYV